MEHAFSHLIYIYKASLAVAASVLLLVACGDKDDPEPNPEPEPTPVQVGQPGVTLNRTAIVYMAAENSLSRFVDADSAEIAQGLYLIPDDARVVVLIDDVKSSRICVGTNEEPLQTVYTFPGNITATDSTTMHDVLAKIIGTYPARHYGITFWSHASGWVEHPTASRVKRRSYGIDNGHRDGYSNDGTEMSITTLAKVLAKLPPTDYVFFDACFMQCIEVAYELRGVTDWVIGSPAEIPGEGAPYQYILPVVCATEFDPELLVNLYDDYYETGDGHLTYYGVEMSAIRTDKLEALASATKPLVMEVFGGRREALLDEVQRYCPRDGSDYYTEYYDMANLFYHNVNDVTYQNWRKACDAAVPYARLSTTWYSALQTPHSLHVDDPINTISVSMFTPGERFDDDRDWNNLYHIYAWYHAAGFDQTGW